MTKFAIIDNYSSYVWGLVEAKSAIEAVRLADEDAGAYGREYSEGFGGDQGYIVYEVLADFDVEDGQDDSEIMAVRAFPEVARFGWADAA